MKKKIIIYGVFVTLLFCLIVSSIYAFVALGKKPINDIENESTTVPSITEEFNAVTSKLLSKYDGVITYDEKSTEIYELTSSEKYILGSNGKLYPDKIKYINIKFNCNYINYDNINKWGSKKNKCSIRRL